MKPKNRSISKIRNVNPSTVLLVKQIVTGAIIFTVLAGIIAGIWYGTRLPAFTISDITASGGATVSPETVTEVIDAGLQGTYLGLIPRRFAFLYPETTLRNAVLAIPRMKEVFLERVSGTKLQATYVEFVPDALWCQTATSTDCWFVDATGYAFAEAPQLTGGSFVRYSNLQSVPAYGETVLSAADFAVTREFVSLLSAAAWYADVIEVDAARDVFYRLTGGGELKASLNDSPETIMNTLVTLRNSPEFSHLEPGNFEYIDLRFGSKLFVKETTDELVTDVSAGDEATTTAVASEVF